MQIPRKHATLAIDPRRAGLILYALEIASTNLPRIKPQEAPQPDSTATIEAFTFDPTLGPIAPPAEWHEAPREKTLVEILEEAWQNEP